MTVGHQMLLVTSMLAQPKIDLGPENDLHNPDLVLGQEQIVLGQFGPAGRFRGIVLVLS